MGSVIQKVLLDIEDVQKTTAVRKFEDYDEYFKFQKTKLSQKRNFIEGLDKRYHKALAKRLREFDFIVPGATALCLGARLGGEVRAFKDLGCFAVGIDAEPGLNNKDVTCADFHKIPFANKSANIVFTNALEHGFDINKILNEVSRFFCQTVSL